MPEIKIKHVVSFSSEDKVHKAENLGKPETYRKWKCATPGEKSASVVLQFEKATQIHSIDIGNESSAFVEVLVGRSSDTSNDYQVLLVASSFMSPLESRNGMHTNRVRMFGPEKLSQSTKDGKWDCVQIVCTQPFNKNITYGLSFVKFHSPPEKNEEQPKSSEAETATIKLGAFKLRNEEEDEDGLIKPGSWFEKQKKQDSQSSTDSSNSQATPSYASVVLASSGSPTTSSQNGTQKRKIDSTKRLSEEPPAKKVAPTSLNKDHIVYKNVLRDTTGNKVSETSNSKNVVASSPKRSEAKKATASSPKQTASSKSTAKNNSVNLNEKVPFEKIMDKVVFVLSGFVNPLRSELRDKALNMGAKYKGDWDNSCTHLVCAFLNTPKFEQVKKLKGNIVTKEWILDCHDKKRRIPWTRYMLGKKSVGDDSPDDSYDDSDYKVEESSEGSTVDLEDSDEEVKRPKRIFTKRRAKNKEIDDSKTEDKSIKEKTKAINHEQNQSVLNSSRNEIDSGTPLKNDKPSTSRHNVSSNSGSPSMLSTRNDSETEDEEAIQDYLADTDGDDSGDDTEDEIRKVEMKIQRKTAVHASKAKDSDGEENYSEKPDVSNLPLPELPNLFKQKHFFMFGKFSSSDQHDMQRFITAYNGIIDDYMNDKIKYVITQSKWDKRFEDALNANEDLIFVKPTWIYKCHEVGKLVPYQPYIVIPDS